jgi:hypothetical protein
MRKLLLLIPMSVVLCGGSLWAQAGNQRSSETPSNWSGLLADASCKEKNPSDACAVSTSTTAFGLVASDGRFYKFDQNGNSKVVEGIQKSGGNATSVSVTGTLQSGNTIKVESIQLR